MMSLHKNLFKFSRILSNSLWSLRDDGDDWEYSKILEIVCSGDVNLPIGVIIIKILTEKTHANFEF